MSLERRTGPVIVQRGADGSFGGLTAGGLVQWVHTADGTDTTGTTTIPLDDTIPQNTEGFEVMTVTITPTSTSNTIRIEAIALMGGVDAHTIVALFRDSVADALAVCDLRANSSDAGFGVIKFQETAPSTSAITYKIRIGKSSGGTVTFNGGYTGVGGGFFADTNTSSITAYELSGT